MEEQICAGAPTESWLEDRLVEFLRQRGYPSPLRQYWVRLPDAVDRRIGGYFPELRATA